MEHVITVRDIVVPMVTLLGGIIGVGIICYVLMIFANAFKD